MNIKNMSFVLLGIALILGGCASPSVVTPYGRDTFIINVDDIWGGISPGKLQVMAAQKANAYCAEQGKIVKVRNTNEHGIQGISSTASSLIFSCIDEDDPENTRTNLRKEPNTVIEDRRE